MKKVLIVVDMQNDFVTGTLANPAAQAIVPNVLKKVREAHEDENTIIIFTADCHRENYLETQEGKKLPVRHCIDETYGQEIIDEISKYTYGKRSLEVFKRNFGTLDWAYTICDRAFLLEEDIEYIELIGVVTDICVVSNALILKATFPETLIKVDATCCAGLTPEKHEAALSVMESCQIEVIR